MSGKMFIDMFVTSSVLLLAFMIIDLIITSHFREKVWKSELGETLERFKRLDFEHQSQIMRLEYDLKKTKDEKESLMNYIDKNLLEAYKEQSIKHKQAKEKIKHKETRLEASMCTDVVFYWQGYVRALEELKNLIGETEEGGLKDE